MNIEDMTEHNRPAWVGDAGTVSEFVWRNLTTRYSHSQMRDQMQRGTWPAGLVRYALATSAARARRHALFHWRVGFQGELVREVSGKSGAPAVHTKRPITWPAGTLAAFAEADAYRILANKVRRKNAPSMPVLVLYKVYLGTFRGQRFAVSQPIM